MEKIRLHQISFNKPYSKENKRFKPKTRWNGKYVQVIALRRLSFKSLNMNPENFSIYKHCARCVKITIRQDKMESWAKLGSDFKEQNIYHCHGIIIIIIIISQPLGKLVKVLKKKNNNKIPVPANLRTQRIFSEHVCQ